ARGAGTDCARSRASPSSRWPGPGPGAADRSLDVHTLAADVLGGVLTAVVCGPSSADLLEDVQAAGDLTEHRVAAGAVAGQGDVVEDQEELRPHALAVVALPRHRQRPSRVDVGARRVLERTERVPGAAGAGRGRVTALQQRVGQQPVASRTVE